MIQVKGLHHRYGPLTAVEELSFDVARGEILGLLGPNGAGKTTAMRSVVGLLTPTRGLIRVAGSDLQKEPLAARRALGYLPENTPLYRELVVREFLCFAARAKGISRRDAGAEADRVIEACGLQSVAKRLIGYCSRGYRQRIGLAQALAADPPVLVLDEPTVGLDPAQIVEIRERIADLAKNKAVLLSTHILPEASALCDRVLILHQGRCVAEDSPERLGETMGGSPRLIVVLQHQPSDLGAQLEALPFVARHEALGLVEDAWHWRVEMRERDQTPELVSKLVQLGCAIREVRNERLGLEDVFLRLVRPEEGEA